MKSFKPILLFVLMIPFFLGSCKSDNTQLKNTKPQSNIKGLDKIKSINKYEEYFKSVGKVKLKTPDTVNIGYIANIYLMNKQEILLQDIAVSKNLLLFNTNGDFIRNIGSHGRGPKEFMSPFCVAVKDSTIAVYDNSLQRVSIYSSQGNFKLSWKVNCPYSKMVFLNDNIAMRQEPFNNQDNYGNIIDIYSTKGDLLLTVKLPISDNKGKLRYLPIMNFGLNTFDNELYYMYPEELKIVCYNIQNNKIAWGTREYPDVLTSSELPVSADNIEKWVDEQSLIFGLYNIDQSLLMAYVGNYYIFYDRHGNLINYVQAPKAKICFFESKLYAINQPKIENGGIVNPTLEIWERK